MSDRFVLCVDDEVHILRSITRLLRNEDYALLTAASGSEGLALMAKQPVQLVISDQRMPEMTGVEFLQRAREVHPETVRVLLSGYADVSVVADAINTVEVFRFLAKPWIDDELKAAIRQGLERHESLARTRRTTEQFRARNAELRRSNTRLEMVAGQRTQALQLYREMLEKVPVPVIGVSRDGTLLSANQAAADLISPLREMRPGAAMREVLPGHLADTVGLWLRGERPADLPPLNWNGRNVAVRIEPLRERDNLTGCMLVLAKLEDEPGQGRPKE